MVDIKLPYDKQIITASIPDKNFAGLLESEAENFSNPLSEQETVEKSMDNPIGSKSLEELAKGKKDIVLISSELIFFVRFIFVFQDPVVWRVLTLRIEDEWWNTGRDLCR